MAAGLAAIGAVWMGAARSSWWHNEDRVAKDSGDVKLEGKQEGSLRLAVGNIRRVKQVEGGGERETDHSKVTEMTEALAAMHADMAGLVDTGLEDGVSPGQAGLWSAGQLRTAMGIEWGGRGMVWRHVQGRCNGKGVWHGGIAQALAERWKGAAGRWGQDNRGFGRYTFRELVGTNGQTLVIAVLYLAPESTTEGAWKTQEEWMTRHGRALEGKQKEGALTKWEAELLEHLSEGAANPKSVALLELKQELRRLKCEYVVVAGDWNTSPPGVKNARGEVETARARRDREHVERFAEELGLVEPLQARLKEGERLPATCVAGDRRSWIDYYLVSKVAVARGLVRAVGVVGDPVNDSDHRMIVMDLDAEGMLGTSRLWRDIEEALAEKKRSNLNAKFKAVQLKKVDRVREFQEALAREWEREGLEGGIRELREWVGQMGEIAWKDEEMQRTLEEQGSELMAQAEAAIIEAQEAVYRKLPVAGRHFKHQMTPEMVSMLREIRGMERLARAIGARVPKAVLKEAASRLRGRGVGLPRHSKRRAEPGVDEGWKVWDQFGKRIWEQVTEMKRHTHGKDRKRMKKMREGRQARLEKAMEAGPDQQIGKAFDNVLRRTRDGAVDAAIVVEEGIRRAAGSGQEVKEYTQRYAQEWMGEGRECWFHFEHGCVTGMREQGARWTEGDKWHPIAQDTEVGRAFRERVVEGKLTQGDLDTIPHCFHGMLKYLRRKEGSTSGKLMEESDYEGCGLLEDVTAEAWRDFWNKASAGKRGGASGVHATLIKAMMKEVWEGEDGLHSRTEQVVEGLRLLVNASRAGRFYYQSWKQELLYFFIKVPGATGLENSRPVGLLEVMLKACYALDFGAITTVWERTGFLEESQHAFRKEKGTEGPLMLWLLMNERAYQTKEDQARGQGDLKHAYDGVFMWTVEIFLGRAGLPRDYVQYVAKLIRETRTAVITPFGNTESFRRSAGLPQGGPQSCGEWNAFIDIMAAMQRGMAKERGVKIEGEWGQVVELLVQMFADDTHHCAAGKRCLQGLEERFRIATLWATFFGAEHRAEKCNAVMGKWTGGKEANNRTLMTQAQHGARVEVVDAMTGGVSVIPMVDPYEDSRALGVQVSMAGYPADAVERARVEAEVTARAISRAPIGAGLGVMIGRAVGWQRLKYRLMLVYAFPEMVMKAAMALKKAVVKSVGLPPGTPLAAVETMVWMDAGQEITLDRIAMLVKLLAGGGAVGEGLKGSIQELQRWVGTERPVLETDLAKCRCEEEQGKGKCKWNQTDRRSCRTSCGWNGSWVGMLHKTMSELGITIVGGLGLPGLREGDRCLVDVAAAQPGADRELVRLGCHAAGVWRLSEVMGLGGDELAVTMLRGGSLERQVGKEGGEWGGAVRKLVQGELDNGRKLGAWRRGEVHGWRLLLWAEGGRLKLGIPVKDQGEQGMEVRSLRRDMGGEGRDRMRKELRRGPVEGTVRSVVWVVERQEMDEEVVHRGAGACWPVVASWVDEEGGGRSWVSIEELPEACQEAVHRQQAGFLSPERMEAKEWRSEWRGGGFVVGLESRKGYWSGGHKRQVGGWGQGDMARLLGEGWWGVVGCRRYECERAKAEEKGEWGVLDVYSDGGADRPGTEQASAEYGWVIGGTDEEGLEVWGEGGAPVRGTPRDMTSNRAELYGLLAVLVKTRGWDGVVRAWLDNSNVKDGVEKLQGKVLPAELWEQAEQTWEQRIRPAANWFQEVQDRDLWEVMALMVAQRGSKLVVEWVRGHSDSRQAYATLTKHQRGNIRADTICNRLKGEKSSSIRLVIPRMRSWRVCWEGVEVAGKVKGELKKKLDARKLIDYFRVKRKWGEAAEEWLGEECVKDWMMTGSTMGARVRAVRSMFSMWNTSDVRAKRSKGTEEEKAALARCELCGEDARGQRNWHLLGRCRHQGVVDVRRRILAQVREKVEEVVEQGGQRQLILLPWELDSEGRLLELDDDGEMGEEMERNGGFDMATGQQISVMCEVVQGGGGRERRQMVYKGMVGRAWVNTLVQWGIERQSAMKLKTKLLKLLQQVVPEIEAVRWREATGEGAGETGQTEEGEALVTEAVGGMRVGDAGLGAGRWRDGTEVRVRGWTAARQVAWAVRVLVKRRKEGEKGSGIEGEGERARRRRGMEKECGERMVRWLGLRREQRGTVRTTWRQWRRVNKGKALRQTRLWARGGARMGEPGGAESEMEGQGGDRGGLEKGSEGDWGTGEGMAQNDEWNRALEEECQHEEQRGMEGRGRGFEAGWKGARGGEEAGSMDREDGKKGEEGGEGGQGGEGEGGEVEASGGQGEGAEEGARKRGREGDGEEERARGRDRGQVAWGAQGEGDEGHREGGGEVRRDPQTKRGREVQVRDEDETQLRGPKKRARGRSERGLERRARGAQVRDKEETELRGRSKRAKGKQAGRGAGPEGGEGGNTRERIERGEITRDTG